MIISSYTVQITHNLNSTHMSHMCEMRGMNHTCVGYLDTHDTCVHAHTILTHTCVFTHVHSCMTNVTSYLPFGLS